MLPVTVSPSAVPLISIAGVDCAS